MAAKRHSESGRTKAQRRKHDQRARQHQEVTTGRPWHASNAVRYTFIAVAVIVVVGMTFLFMAGFIRW